MELGRNHLEHVLMLRMLQKTEGWVSLSSCSCQVVQMLGKFDQGSFWTDADANANSKIRP
jgi:hypothetical protein